ncbi:hypothetical protein VTK56DRAFT_7053 [Thermocarpiscus australiensis]
MPPKPKPPVPTHFLCIPLATPASRAQLAASLAAFRADVCSPLGFAVPEDAVRPVGTIHLTLGVFSFRSSGREGAGGGNGNGDGNGSGNGNSGEPEAATLARAREVLGGLRLREIWRRVRAAPRPRMPGTMVETDRETRGEKEWEGEGEGEEGEEEGPPRITLRGLASMRAPARAAVLYAPPVDQLGLLQAFCERVREVFREGGLLVDDGRPLLLHATVVNTVYVRGGKNGKAGEGGSGRRRGGGGGRKWERLVFDATGILDRYEDQVWVQDVPVERIAICKMGAKTVVVDGVEDEEYEVEAEVEF